MSETSNTIEPSHHREYLKRDSHHFDTAGISINVASVTHTYLWHLVPLCLGQGSKYHDTPGWLIATVRYEENEPIYHAKDQKFLEQVGNDATLCNWNARECVTWVISEGAWSMGLPRNSCCLRRPPCYM